MELYDAIIVGGAAMQWNPDAGPKDPETKKRPGKWSLQVFVDPEIYKPRLVMGFYRALAAKEAQSQAPLILVTGGSDTHPITGEKHLRSAVLRDRIVELGVSEDRVEDIGGEGMSNIPMNILSTIDYLNEHPEILNIHRLGILYPRFQTERGMLMFNASPYFSNHGIELVQLVVEDVLSGNPRFTRAFTAIYNTEIAGEMEKGEKQGIEDFKSGKYVSQNPQSTR